LDVVLELFSLGLLMSCVGSIKVVFGGCNRFLGRFRGCIAFKFEAVIIQRLIDKIQLAHFGLQWENFEYKKLKLISKV